MLKIIKNPDEQIYEEVSSRVEENGGYCPCAIEQTEDTKCICKEFWNSTEQGECHCGRFIKVESN